MKDPTGATEPESGSPGTGPRRPDDWLRGLSLDLRSLALFRVALGCCLVADLIHRLPGIDDFYTDRGVIPREALFRLADPWTISIHVIRGGWVFESVLFLTALVFALGLVVGYRTRLCAIASWVLISSMHTRNPMVVHGGDVLMRLLLFWSIFLPLNGRWSMDRTLNPDERPLPDRHLSVAGMAFVFQVCAMYWFAASEKMHPEWLTERSAIYYALSYDVFATPFGQSLLEFPGLLRQLTTGTLLLEILGPLIAISPIFSGPLRLVVVAAFLGFHAGLGSTLRLGTFSWICSAAWLAFLPAVFWDSLQPRLSHHGRGRVFGAFRLADMYRRVTQRVRAVRRGGVLVPSPPRQPSLVSKLVVIAALLLVTTSLLSKKGMTGGLADPSAGLRLKLASLTQLGQSWRMFAPYPSPHDGWFLMEGEKADGSRIDVWNGGGVPTEAKPSNMAAFYRNVQWAEYLILLAGQRFAEYRPYFGRYLCRTWNAEHAPADQVRLVDIDFMLEQTPPPGQPLGPPKRLRGWRQTCLKPLPVRAPATGP